MQVDTPDNMLAVSHGGLLIQACCTEVLTGCLTLRVRNGTCTCTIVQMSCVCVCD